MARRDITSRYRGSMLGIVWSLLIPLMMLGIYTTVFGLVFNAKWNAGAESHADFAMVLFCGLIVFNLFSECVNRAPGLVLGNPNYVKKIPFPIEILPWIAILSSLFNLVTSLAILIAGIFITSGTVPWTAALWPLVLAPLVFVIAGISWFLASLGVYLRDIGYLTGVVLNVLLYLSPIFYPVSAAPPMLQRVLELNPLTYVIEDSRKIALWGVVPDPYQYLLSLAASLAIALGGFAWFQKTRKGFADVL